MGSWGIACCRVDDEPLVMTFAFRGEEFICVHCGTLYTYFGPKGLDETPERLARMEENRATWEELSKGLIGEGAYRLDDCDKCKAHIEGPHTEHATAEESLANAQALSRLVQLTQGGARV